MKLDPKYDHYDYPTTSPNVQSGHPGHTTPEQDAQVYQLRMKLEADGYTERLDTLTLVSARSHVSLGRASLMRALAAIPTGTKVRCCPFRKDVSANRLPHHDSVSKFMIRFVDCEKWRKDTDLDNLTRNFDYHEKPQVFEYYPQYYHKTDKVRHTQQLANTHH